MNKLRIKLIEGSLLDEFQVVDISVISYTGAISIFQGKVNLSELLDWFKENEHEIKSSDLPIDRGNGGSLARKIRDFYESVDTENDEVVDSMFDYRSHHCLRFAVRGTLIPEIYIGKSGHNYEISMSGNDGEWGYFIDIEDFFNQFKN
ncbi:hypothetical protein [[Enterobacter] lignolyticus]|uniref:Uncharacterized protein n=2 Tax=[Enterobacter] lignolyticus TaxID=1334193 RepID=E3G4S2_ENTLS|nr:hypothetical protein [[Enterobacter] lignolyticus]ADO50540.1 hypothetical protein Entcl_4309 [[Enterobacter] lignolyticus SCF1]ALR74828.1 hypothetical protein AO703_00300 [[Enterobacter] lignolyticus]